jgi:hypothetical protein
MNNTCCEEVEKDYDKGDVSFTFHTPRFLLDRFPSRLGFVLHFDSGMSFMNEAYKVQHPSMVISATHEISHLPIHLYTSSPSSKLDHTDLQSSSKMPLDPPGRPSRVYTPSFHPSPVSDRLSTAAYHCLRLRYSTRSCKMATTSAMIANTRLMTPKTYLETSPASFGVFV